MTSPIKKTFSEAQFNADLIFSQYFVPTVDHSEEIFTTF